MNEMARRSITEATEALDGATHESRFDILEGYMKRSYDRLPEWAEPMDGDAIAVLPGDAVLAYGAEHDCGRDRDGDRILLRDVLVYTDEDTFTVVSSAADVKAASAESRAGIM